MHATTIGESPSKNLVSLVKAHPFKALAAPVEKKPTGSNVKLVCILIYHHKVPSTSMIKPGSTQINAVNSWVLRPTRNEEITERTAAIHRTINQCLKYLQNRILPTNITQNIRDWLSCDHQEKTTKHVNTARSRFNSYADAITEQQSVPD